MFDRETAKHILAYCLVNAMPDTFCLNWVQERSDSYEIFDDLGLAEESPSLQQLVHEFRQSKDPVLARKLCVLWEHWGLFCVSDRYIVRKLNDYGIHVESLSGDRAPLTPCPCCLYLVYDASDDDFYSICPVCYWENDYSHVGKTFIGINGITLEEARLNFARYGASTIKRVTFVDPEGPEKYDRSVL